MNFDSILSEMFAKVIIQLYKEYDYICYLYKLQLKKPLILIEDLSSEWGSWDSTFKMIRLSKKLITDYPWDIVIQILKHEIAHQIVSEIYLSQSNHGELFHKACEQLAIKPQFRKANLNLQNLSSAQDFPNFDTAEQVMLRKVEKLLNLAQSANEHEALLAMEKVQELYQKYNITHLEQKNEGYFSSIFIHFKKKNVPSTFQYLSSLIQNHFFVNIIYSESYDYLNNENYKTIEIIGRPCNVKMAEYVFYFLKDKIEKLWQEYHLENKVSGRFKLSYQKGVIEGFQTKLELQKKNIEKEHILNLKAVNKNLPALLDCELAKLNDFTKKLYPKLSTKCSTASAVYSEYYAEGKSAGKKIILNKPLTEKSKSNLLLQNR